MVMMYHEGGWSMGDLTDEDMNCRMFVRDLGVVAVNVEYRYIYFFSLLPTLHFFFFQSCIGIHAKYD